MADAAMGVWQQPTPEHEVSPSSDPSAHSAAQTLT
jgi:hypothetical protein